MLVGICARCHLGYLRWDGLLVGSKVALAYIRAISAPLILSVVTFDYAAGWPGNLSAFAAYRPSARIPLAPPERGGVVSRSFYISRCIPEYSDGPMQKGTCDLSVVKVGGAGPSTEWEAECARVCTSAVEGAGFPTLLPRGRPAAARGSQR